MLKLSHAAALKAAPGDILVDDHVKGLELHVKTRGKSWFYYYRFAGERRRPKLGEFPSLQIGDAREAARGLAVLVAQGRDPAAERKERRDAPTVNELCEVYLANPATQELKPKTILDYTKNINTYVRPALGAKKVKDVTAQDIEDLLRGIAAKGVRGLPAPVMANRVRAILSIMFNFAEAEARKWRPRYSNPALDDSTPRFTERKRKRFATPDELKALADALDHLETEWPYRVAALRCILLCGTRVTELVTARWEQLQGNVITLREHKTMKTGDDREIILPTQALALIEALPRDGSGFIFGPGLTDFHIRTVYAMARRRAGIRGLAVRDLRRTFASAAKTSGHSLDAIGEIFGHKDALTTRRYAWLFAEGAGNIVQGTADVLTGHMAGGTAPPRVRRHVKWVRGRRVA